MRGHDQPTVIFLNVRKGASSFIATEFAAAMQSILPGLQHQPVASLLLDGRDIDSLALPPKGVLASRVYPELHDQIVERPVPPEGRFADKTLIMVRRDPRDVAVSEYYSAAFSHPVLPGDAAQWFLQRRERLRSLPVVRAIHEDTGHTAMKEFRACDAFLRRYPQTFLAPYEMLVSNPEAWMARVLPLLGISDGEIPGVTAQLRPRLTPPAKENPHAHRRRIRPGNWREVFDDQLCDLFRDELGGALTLAGYSWDNQPTEVTPAV